MRAQVRFILDVYDAIQSWIALAVVGILSGVVAAMVAMGTDWANDSKFGTCVGRGFWITRQMCCKDSADLLQCPNWRSWGELAGGSSPESIQLISYFFYVIIAICQAGYSAWLCKTFAPYAVGSGIGEIKVIMSGFVIKRFLGGWTLLIKSLGLILSVGSGMAIGKEGPFIHLSCCLANVVSRMFSKYSTNEGKKRELLSCAAAAGIAVAFGAPIGGVLFSLEEVTTYFPAKAMWRSLFCAVLAAMALQRMNPLNQSGKLVLFEVRFSKVCPRILDCIAEAAVNSPACRVHVGAAVIKRPAAHLIDVPSATDAVIIRSRITINGSSLRWPHLC